MRIPLTKTPIFGVPLLPLFAKGEAETFLSSEGL